MSTLEAHWEILPELQRQFWPSLKGSTELGFVLYGGTAVALRLGHRASLDFDLFTERILDREAMSRTFGFLHGAKVIQDRKDTLSVLAPIGGGTVKVSFFGDISIGRVGEPGITPDGIMEIASLTDLLATKLKVMQQRIEAKDYQDVIAILKAGVSLESGLAAAVAMFGSNFQPSESLKALGYFAGGDLDTLSGEQKKYLSTMSSRVRHVPFGAVASHVLSTRG